MMYLVYLIVALIAGAVLHEVLGLFMKSYRTVTVNITMAVSALAAWAADYDWAQLIDDPKQATLVAAWWGLYQTYQRFRTNSGVGEARADE